MTTLIVSVLVAHALAMQADPPNMGAASTSLPREFHLEFLGQSISGVVDQSGSEIATYDFPRKRLIVVNGAVGLDFIDVSNPANPLKLSSFPCAGTNSVAIHGDLIAIAVAPKVRSIPGEVVFIDHTGQELRRMTVGANPDMVVFSPDGKTLLVANEGEADEENKIDPEGTVSVIDLSNGVMAATLRTADFRAFNTEADALKKQGACLFVPNHTVAQQLEPEYIAMSNDGMTAFITLQEANAMAVVDIPSARITSVFGLGLKDFSKSGLDPSDKDGGIHINPWPVFALRQPDAVVAWEQGGVQWLATANEGEQREGATLSDSVKVGTLALDRGVFAKQGSNNPGWGWEDLVKPEHLGRLDVCGPMADLDADGDADRLVCFGGRGVTVWKFVDGKLLEAWDSGSDVERIVAERMPAAFNADSRKNPSQDQRSKSRGPEVEGLTTGIVDGRRLLFAGLERPGGVVTWDITDPTHPVLLDYANQRNTDAPLNIDKDAGLAIKNVAGVGDLGPEGLVFLSADKSPNGSPMVVVCNEISGTTSLWQVKVGPKNTKGSTFPK